MIVCLALTGCFEPPGPIKPSDLNRYAEAMVRRMQQQDRGETGKPDPIKSADILGTFDTEIDPETNKKVIKLKLEDAVRRAVTKNANNLDIRVMSFNPEISREEMTRAAAVFDMVVFAGATYGVEDQRQNTLFDKTSLAKSRAFQVGLRKRTTTGAELMAMYALTRVATNTTWKTEATSYEPNFTLELTQPLLKGAGEDVNLAALRVARIDRRTSEAAFQERVDAVIADVVSAYWALRLARADLAIQERLEKTTEVILATIKLRIKVDATKMDIKQAEAALAARRALVIRARKGVRDIEDALVQLVLGKQGPFAVQAEIVPDSEPPKMVEQDYDDLLRGALVKNSQLAQAMLAVEAAGINVQVAERNMQPTLDLRASATWMGMDKHVRTGNDQMIDSKYLSYSVGLVLEYPLGNREAGSARRRARYERLQAVTNLRNVALQVARTVRERVREVHRAKEDLAVVESAVKANEDYLAAIMAQEKLKKLTPQFLLQLKLQALEALGRSQRDVEQAIVDYNTALVQLWQVSGTMRDHYGVVLDDVDEVPVGN